MVSFQQLKFIFLLGSITVGQAMVCAAATPFPTGFVHPVPSPIVETVAHATTTAVATASATVTDAVTHIATTAPKELAATFNALRDSMYDLFVRTTGCLDNMGLRVQGTSSWVPKLLTPCAAQQATSFKALATDTIPGDACTSGAYSALAEGISQANTYVQEAINGPSSIWASNPCLRNPDCVAKLFDAAATTTPEGNAARNFLNTAFNELVRIKATLAEKLYADYQTRSCADGYLARINTVSQEKLSEVQAFLNPEYVCENVCSNTRAAASWISATCGSIGAYLATVDATTWKVVGTVAALYVTVKYGPRWCRSLWARCRRQQAEPVLIPQPEQAQPQQQPAQQPVVPVQPPVQNQDVHVAPVQQVHVQQAGAPVHLHVVINNNPVGALPPVHALRLPGHI